MSIRAVVSERGYMGVLTNQECCGENGNDSEDVLRVGSGRRKCKKNGQKTKGDERIRLQRSGIVAEHPPTSHFLLSPFSPSLTFTCSPRSRSIHPSLPITFLSLCSPRLKTRPFVSPPKIARPLLIPTLLPTTTCVSSIIPR